MAHDLDALIRFCERDVWHDCFEEVFDYHFGAVLDACQTDFEGITSLLSDGEATALWGCAFEDFLTQSFEGDPVNAADDYLKRRGWKESAANKAFIKGLRHSVFSLWRVESVAQGVSFTARDLLRGGEPVVVADKRAASTLSVGHHIGARIFEARGALVMSGGVLLFSEEEAQKLIATCDAAAADFGGAAAPAMDNETLSVIAPRFSESFLIERAKRALAVNAPHTQDGAPIVLHEIRFPLAPGTSVAKVEEKMATLSDVVGDDGYWMCLAAAPQEDMRQRSFDAVTADRRVVLWRAAIHDGALLVEANSVVRAAQAQEQISAALDVLARTPSVRSWSVMDALLEVEDA
jgi:hypothetical protein